MGLTGQKAMAWKIRYLESFNRMEVVDEAPYAAVVAERQAHLFEGHSLAERASAPHIEQPDFAFSLPLSPIEGEYRVNDLALAQAMGFSTPYNIRNLIRFHFAELKAFGRVSRLGHYYYLNERQTAFLCHISKTRNARALIARIADLFTTPQGGPAQQPALPQPRTLTPSQCRTIQKLIQERWTDQASRHDAYERLKDKFQVPRYCEIPQSRFDEAVVFIESAKHARRVTVTFPVERPDGIVDDASCLANAIHTAATYKSTLEDLSKQAGRLRAVAEDLENKLHHLTARAKRIPLSLAPSGKDGRPSPANGRAVQ
ncbi:MAG: ORF6C domain-containing protein [Hyphomicrobiales bacterium]